MNVLLSRQSCCCFPAQRRRGLQRVTLSSPTSSPDFQTLGRCSSITLTFSDARQMRKRKKKKKTQAPKCLHQQVARRHRFPCAVICGSRCLIVVTGSFLISSDDNITPKRSSLARNDRREDARVERLRNQQRVAAIAPNTTRLQGCAGCKRS